MPGGVLPYQEGFIMPDLLRFMRSFDYRIGTLESAIGTGLPFDPVKMNGRQNIIYARNEDLLKPLMEEVLSREALPLANKVCKVVPAALGESIGDYAALSVAANI